jgi:hypothetical protein
MSTPICLERHQHIRRFEVAVDDRLLVRVLDTLADALEQLQPLARGQAILVTEMGDGLARHVLHDKERAAARRRAGVEHLGHGGMVHHGQRLPLGLEACHDLPRVHPVLDHLERYLATHGFLLLGEPDLAHSASAHEFVDAVAMGNDRTGTELSSIDRRLGDRGPQARFGRCGRGRDGRCG